MLLWPRNVLQTPSKKQEHAWQSKAHHLKTLHVTLFLQRVKQLLLLAVKEDVVVGEAVAVVEVVNVDEAPMFCVQTVTYRPQFCPRVVRLLRK